MSSHLRLVPGDQMSITVAPKGAGSENMTTLKMLKPTTPLDEVENAIIQAVEEAGSNPCPPVVVGIGIGGNSERVPCWLSGRCCVPWTSTTLTRCIGKWRSVCWNVSIS